MHSHCAQYYGKYLYVFVCKFCGEVTEVNTKMAGEDHYSDLTVAYCFLLKNGCTKKPKQRQKKNDDS